VEKVIGAGGMGVVYRGTDLKLERPVAIKLIATERAGDESARRRFEREARLMAAIDHPNVIPVYAAGEQDGDLYLVMRFVDGTDLHQRLRREGALGPGETARVIDQVARALDAAHGRGLVHRDIKPANVLLSGEHVYLTDFGITRLIDENTHTTETGDWVGTIDFMSPEHLRGEETDARSDVYSLGCVLYACLTGVPPFKRTTVAATIAAHLNDRPPLPSHTHPGVPPAFDQIVGRALAKSPSHRYASAGEMAEAVTDAAAGRPNRWGRAVKRTNTGPSESPTRLTPEEAGPTRRLELEAGLEEVAAPEAVALRAAARRVARRARATEAAARKPAPEPSSAPAPETGRASTRVQGADAVPTLRLSESPDANARRRGPVVVAAAALLVAIAAVAVVLGLHTAKAKPLTPFSRSQVSVEVNAFANAYSRRDSTAMSALLAPGVTRRDPTGVEQGVAAVLANYRKQFTTQPVPIGYRLSGMVLTPGWVGRASGDYTVTLTGGGSLHGHVIFAIQRIGDRTVISLIVTQQDSTSAAPAGAKTKSTTATTTDSPEVAKLPGRTRAVGHRVDHGRGHGH
jgi:hypothetical protein